MGFKIKLEKTKGPGFIKRYLERRKEEVNRRSEKEKIQYSKNATVLLGVFMLLCFGAFAILLLNTYPMSVEITTPSIDFDEPLYIDMTNERIDSKNFSIDYVGNAEAKMEFELPLFAMVFMSFLD